MNSPQLIIFFLLNLIIFEIYSIGFAQQGRQPDRPQLTNKHINFYGETKEVPAYRLNHPVKLDGILSEQVWQNPGVTGFTQRDPHEGKPATEKTVVWVAYDDEAIYAAARMFDSSPDSIVALLGRRDKDLTTDYFAIAIDAYRDKQTGFYFLLTPAGAIADGRIYNDSWFDDTWDGVWDGAVKTDSLGWCVEMRIPYSQLRFTKKDEYIWGFNVERYVQRKQETSQLVVIPKKASGHVSFYPSLVGIKNIQPPRRLEILPYGVASGQFLSYGPDDPFDRDFIFYKSAGADLKIGLSSNFTLDGTVNPDFGQVELDPAVVNLTAFETFYDEKRPFFIEGANIFSFGQRGATNYWGFNSNVPSFFYSRRIGRAPQVEPVHDGEEDIPTSTTIIGAAKISGKTRHNWEIGVLNALTSREYAEVDSAGVRFQEEAEPLTFYNVTRAFKNFKDNRFGLGFLSTAVIRDLRTENLQNSLRRNAFAGGLDGYLFFGKTKKWALSGWFGASQVSGSKQTITDLQESPQHYYQRPDFEHEHLDTNRTSLGGWASRVALNKEKGNYYINAAVGVNSPGFETNDLGFHWQGNIINQHLVGGYKWFEPGKVFRNASVYLANFRSFDFDGNRTAEGVMGFVYADFLNYWGMSFDGGYNPETLDITRTRGGPIMISPPAYWFDFTGYSDNRKQVVLNLSGSYSANTPGGWDYSLGAGLQWKPGSRLEVQLSPSFYRDHAIAQWIDDYEDPTAVHTFATRYIFGILDHKQVSASIRVNYTFTPKLSFQLFMQPLLATGHYSDIKELAKPRTFDFNHYGKNGSTITATEDEYLIDPDGTGQNNFAIENPDFNFKSLRGTAVMRWEFAPGSALFLVWTHDRSNDEGPGYFNFRRDLDKLLGTDADNVLLLKLSYWFNP